MDNSKIGTKEAISLILTIAIAHTIVSTPRNLLSSMKSAVLLNLIYVGFILVGVSFIVVKLFKNFPASDILDISEYLGGKKFKTIIGFLFIAYFIISSSILLREFAEAIKIIYYPITNIFFIVLLFIISVSITGKLEFTATIKANLIITPIVLFSSIFLFASNLKCFSAVRIFPLLGEGFFNTFILGIGNISSFAGIAFLYFLPPLLKKPEDFKKISLTSVVIFFVYLFFNVAVILFIFSYLMTENEILPLYTASQYIQIGDFLVRLEVVFLLIWMEIFACYLSIVNKFCMLILQKITNIENSKVLCYPFAILMLGIALIPNSFAQIKNFESNIYPYILIDFIYVFCILLLIFANLKRKKVGVKNDWN